MVLCVALDIIKIPRRLIVARWNIIDRNAF